MYMWSTYIRKDEQTIEKNERIIVRNNYLGQTVARADIHTTDNNG